MKVDDELRGVFWDLQQIGDRDEPKYRGTLLKRLAAKILDGQAYEQIAFRLCQLVHGAVFAGGHNRRAQSYLEFFCDPGSGRSSWATGYFRHRLPTVGDDPRVVAASDRILLRYPDRDARPYVTYASMPMLSAFMDFLLNTIHFQAVREILAPLENPGVSYRDVQDVSNTLSRAIYAYLREHVGEVQETRNFDAISRFMLNANRTNDRDDFEAGDIDDDAVLEFWRVHSLTPKTEFKTYRKSFRAFLKFGEQMRAAELRSGFDRPVSFGADREAGEWDPADPSSPGLDMMSDSANVAGDWQTGFDDDEEAGSILERLASSEIKFLLGNEMELLELVEAHSEPLIRLVHSFLRDRSFGHAQGRISAALKKNRRDLSDLVFAAPETGYDDVVGAFEKIQFHMNDLVDAAAFVLLKGDEDDGGLDFATLTRGRKALNGLKRKGFDAVRNGDPDAVAEFRDAVPDIVALQELIAPLGAKLKARVPWSPRQDEDHTVFSEQFSQIYGVAS